MLLLLFFLILLSCTGKSPLACPSELPSRPRSDSAPHHHKSVPTGFSRVRTFIYNMSAAMFTDSARYGYSLPHNPMQRYGFYIFLTNF